MRRAGMLLGAGVALSLAGCIDGSVSVSFDYPPIDEVARLRAVVYAEPSGGDFDCDKLAFGEIPGDILEASEVSDVESAPGERVGLGQIPRQGDKLIFAEALTQQGVSVFAGCAPLGTIEGDVQVLVEAEPRKSVLAIDRLFPDGVNSRGAEVRLSNLAGGPATGQAVKWSAIGPAGFSDSGVETTDDGGNARIAVATPERAGPVRLDIRVRWGATELTQLTGFLDPARTELEMPAGSRTSLGDELLEVAHQGTDTEIVALGSTSLASFDRLVQIHCIDGAGQLRSRTEQADGARTLVHLSTAGGEKIVAVADDGGGLAWKEYGCDATQSRADPFAGSPDHMAAVGNCGSAGQLVFAQQSGAAQLETATPQGIAGEPVDLSDLGLLGSADAPPELLEGGCADSVGGTLPALVLGAGRGGAGLSRFTPLLFTIDGDGTRRAGGVQAEATAAWVRPSAESGEAPLVLGEITETGPQLSRFQLFPIDPNAVLGIEDGAEPLPSLILDTAAGDVDGDGLLDLVSLLPLGIGGDGTTVTVHVSLALPNTEDRLSATITRPITDISVPRLRLVDANGDGVDDIVVGSATRILLLTMGAPD